MPFVGDDDDDGVRRWFDVVFETPAELDSELMYFFVVRSREIGNWKLLRSKPCLISHSQSRLAAPNRISRRESFVSKFAHKTTCSFHLPPLIRHKMRCLLQITNATAFQPNDQKAPVNGSLSEPLNCP